MSAENWLAIFRMENGGWWIVDQAAGATMAEYQGECRTVVAKHPTYEAAIVDLKDLDNPDSPNYCYTEHGTYVRSKDKLMADSPCFLHSTVYIRAGLRECSCVDSRDIYKDDWWVYEAGSANWKAPPRVLGKNLPFGQAVTLASTYGTGQPGDCRIQLPTHFRRFNQYPDHDCNMVEGMLDVPGREY